MSKTPFFILRMSHIENISLSFLWGIEIGGVDGGFLIAVGSRKGISEEGHIDYIFHSFFPLSFLDRRTSRIWRRGV